MNEDLKDCLHVVRSKPYPALQSEVRRAETYSEIRESGNENLRRFRAIQESKTRKDKSQNG